MLLTGATALRPAAAPGCCFPVAEFSRKRGPILLAGEPISQLGPPTSIPIQPKIAAAAVAAALVFSVAVSPPAEAGSGRALQQQEQSAAGGGGGGETLSNVPQSLSGQCASRSGHPEDCKKARIQRPKSRKAETCTVKCVNTCIRGGVGGPGEGPLNIRRPLVVFKPGFRSRQYCLVECSDICNLIRDGDDGP